MYAAFNLILSNKLDYYYDLGTKLLDENKALIRKGLESFILKDGFINGTKIQSNWFPLVEADVFISYAYKDEKKAVALAGWLNENFKLKVFVDSCVWGYSEELLKIIDDNFCFEKDKDQYDYFKRNKSTSHVHMMLSIALSKMIDNTECLIFLNTPNSLNVSGVINSTVSPWIYYEIAMIKLIRKRNPNLHRIKSPDIYVFNSNLPIKYYLEMDELIELSEDDLYVWKEKYISGNSLDTLYEMKSLLKKD
ncbi:hypothetical protein [Clostridium sp. 'White wine YQ']|uniref:hypothetical protein n=1 Tax=Clostridium sp. 'White wine YQ' TaxID=3027474 RepID=UPI0023656655|nr:hypothetical protein [Clostridium sp. 'White wine YQ']MDD7793343.1 hypothetical protein [Clostridium sp. 'White wine YQ']